MKSNIANPARPAMSKQNKMQTYTYTGPDEYHAVVGQVLAGVGYIGGKETTDVGAYVTIAETQGRFTIQCRFCQGEEEFATAVWLVSTDRVKQAVKECLLHWHSRFTGAKPSPWGSLLGVRPTKLVHSLFDQGLTTTAAKAYLQDRYHVVPEKAEDLVEMAALQRPYVCPKERTVSVYIGIPYCSSHCLYCSFPSRLIGQEKAAGLEDFVAAVIADLQDVKALCQQYGLTISTAYVGGGTPTCLPYDALRRLLGAMKETLGTVREWTVEAGRPDTATPEKLQLLYDYGVDRISVNPQTLQQPLLDALGRRHTVADIYTMYETCKAIGFPVVNMDFIAGLPRQTREDMQENMEKVCQLHPENVTIHTLALKKRAPLFHHPLRDEIPPAADVEAMLAQCQEILRKAGYIPYYMYRQTYMAASLANVGYALPEAIGIYNIEMMEERQDILGVGPGSSTKFRCADGHSLKKLYMPKTVDTYVTSLAEKMAQRRNVCAAIYGGEDW